MKIISVDVSPKVLALLLETERTHPSCRIKRGLPKDSRVVGAIFENEMVRLTFVAEAEAPGTEYVRVDVEVEHVGPAELSGGHEASCEP